jgi:ureidoacrylate peracid hydrolase
MNKVILLRTKPEPIKINLARTGVIVVDMQNGFVSKGGMLDLVGVDLYGVRMIISPCKEVITKAREKGCKIIYLLQSYSPDLSNSGGKDSPNWYKSQSLIFIRQHPEYREAGLIDGTWGAEIIDDLNPKKDSILIKKQRYSGFVGTPLNLTLKTYGIKYLVFIGTVANVCVESTLRDAYFHDYFPILITDAVGNVGPNFVLEAAMHTVERAFGWVIDSRTFCEDLK